MAKENEDIRPDEADKKNIEDIVELDKNSPVLQRARELMARAVIRERLAILAEIQALDLRGSGLEDSASDLWGEMPLVARKHESSLEDGTGADESPGAEDSEFGDYGGVPAC